MTVAGSDIFAGLDIFRARNSLELARLVAAKIGFVGFDRERQYLRHLD
jgi:hypothetical protein